MKQIEEMSKKYCDPMFRKNRRLKVQLKNIMLVLFFSSLQAYLQNNIPFLTSFFSFFFSKFFNFTFFRFNQSGSKVFFINSIDLQIENLYNKEYCPQIYERDVQTSIRAKKQQQCNSLIQLIKMQFRNQDQRYYDKNEEFMYEMEFRTSVVKNWQICQNVKNMQNIKNIKNKDINITTIQLSKAYDDIILITKQIYFLILFQNTYQSIISTIFYVWISFIYTFFIVKFIETAKMDWKNKPHMIFNKVKQQMYSKGVQSFFYVDHHIRHYDPEFTGKLSPHDFNLFLNKCGFFPSTQQLRNIRDIYGVPNQEIINYMDFLQDVKYSIPEKVINLLNYVFDVLDPKGTGSLSYQELCKKYNPNQHPHVLSRRKAPQDVYGIFSNGMARKAQNGIVSKQGFIDYYAQLNFCIPNQRQDYFISLVKGTWCITNPQDYVCPKRLRQMQLIIFEKIREKSDGKTNQWKTGKKAFHYFDLADKNCCDLESFKNGLNKFGCIFKDHEIKALFNKYDANRNGVLQYEEFSKMLMDTDINGMTSKPNLLTTLGTNYWKVTH